LKKRIGVWIHGGIGSGNFSQGQPVIGQIVSRLSRYYEIIVYSQLPPNKGFASKDFIVHSAPSTVKSTWIRWTYLMIVYFYNHIKKRHQLTYAFWGYPAGVIAVLLGKLFQKPSIIHLQGGDSVSMPELKYGAFYTPLSKKLSSWAYSQCSLLIALTLFQKKIVESHGVRRKIEVIPYGPDLTIFKINPEKIANNTYQFIHIGNHNLLKDQITLLRAFSVIASNLANCRLKIIGHDALEGKLKNYSIQLGIEDKVDLIEQVPFSDIPKHLSTADVLLHTSIYEGQATVISEAAASGVLLAGTRVGLLSDLGDNYGIVVDIGDAENLAERVLKVLHDKDQIAKFINRSRDWAETHDHEWTVTTIEKNIRILLDNE
jgi:glycosyltransferase involved in cell wall biosynthesis